MSSLSSLLSSLSSSSTSSYDLSSILQAAYGSSSSGIDVSSAVSAAVTAAQAPEDTWSSQESLVASQMSTMSALETDVSSLDNVLQSLNSYAGALSSMTANSSNSDVLTATASFGSSVGSHVIVVNHLATTASWTSETYSSSSTAMSAGSFTITTASGTSQTITTDGSETLSDVASAINSDNLGVTAKVITDTTGSRLAIVANSSGANSNFTITTNSSDYGFTQAATGANASLTVDGIGYSSASNSVTGAISGVTLKLLSADPGVEVSLSVAPNTSSIESTIEEFVSTYNTVISDLKTQFTVTNGSEGVLSTDSTVRSLQSELLSAIDYSYSPSSGSTTISNLSSLGISVDNNGKLSLNTSTLESAMENNYSDVQSFFQGTSLNGFASSLNKTLNNYISTSDGAFTVDLQNMNSQISTLEANISNFETYYISPLKTRLETEYSDAEEALQSLPTELAQIKTELGYNNSNG